MNAAYFSTATAIGSCNWYSRFTISGGLLMIDICSPSFFFLFGPNPDTGKINRRVTCNLSASNNFPSPRACAFRQEVIDGCVPDRCQRKPLVPESAGEIPAVALARKCGQQTMLGKG